MHWWSNACLIGVALMAVTTAFGQVKEIAFYVAPNGDDAWSGRLPAPNAPRTDGPFATLHRAIEAIRQLKRQRGGALHQPVTVYLREGTYFLREPIVLTPEDSGTSECPITFAAYRKERPIISGGRLLTNWRREKVNGKVAWVAEVPEAASGKWFFRLLRVGNAWAIRARYPNFDPQNPLTGGWLFAQWWGEPWERGAFNVGVGRIHNVGDRLEWRIRVPAAGEYRLWIRYAHNMKNFGVDKMDERTVIRVGEGAPVPLRHLPDTGSWGNFTWALAATVHLPAGEQTLVWENVKGGGLNIDAMALTDDPEWHPDKAIQILGWWGEYRVAPPKEGKHLLLIQAEACTKAIGKEVQVPKPSLPGMRDRIVVAEDKFPRWRDWDGAEIHLFPAWGWVNAILKVDGVDRDKRTIFVKCEQDIRPGNRFFIAGVREALDAPNEWHLVAQAGKVFYLPPKGLDPNRTEIVAPRMDRLFVLQGDAQNGRFVEHLRFIGLTFTDTDYTAPGGYYTHADAAIWLVAARHCVIEGCHFVRLGGYAVRMEQQSHGNEIVGNTMQQLGGGGVILLGNTKTQPHDNLIAFNEMSDLGLIYKHVAGVYVTTGSGNRIAHNTIRRVPRYGISLKSYGAGASSHRNIVEFNEIIDSNLETNDTGAIETLGRDQQPSGNIIRFNFIRNVVGMGTDSEGKILTPYFTWGIYLDDYSSGTTVYGNIVIGTVLGAICLHGGKDNLVENNIFVDGKEHQIRLQPRDEFMTGNIFRRNIVVFSDPKAVLWYSWAQTWGRHRLAECDFNLYWHTGGLDIEKTEKAITPEGNFERWRTAGFDRHSLITDPKFFVAKPWAKEDFRLRPDSPAFKLGFQPIPIDQIGAKPKASKKR
jgi:parallel beta-helix repeat protein